MQGGSERAVCQGSAASKHSSCIDGREGLGLGMDLQGVSRTPKKSSRVRGIENMNKRNQKENEKEGIGGSNHHDSPKRLCMCTDTWRIAVHVQKMSTIELHETHVAKLQATNVRQLTIVRGLWAVDLIKVPAYGLRKLRRSTAQGKV